MQNCWTVVVQLPCCTPFSIPNQSIVPYRVITVASWPAHRFFRGQVRWSGVPISFKSFPQFVMIHTVKGFSVVDETSVDVFYGIPLLYDPASVGNLIYGSSAFSKPSLDIWKFLFHMLWSLACKILTRTFLTWEVSAVGQWLAHSAVLYFLGTGMRIFLFRMNIIQHWNRATEP